MIRRVLLCVGLVIVGSFSLLAAERAGGLIVATEPLGATVYVDGAAKGETPLTLSDVGAGDHRVRVAKDQYLDHSRVVTVRAGKTDTLTVRLTAREAQPSIPLSLKIVVIQGEDSINVIQTGTATAAIVEVRDRNDQPVAGVLVLFTIRGRANATFAGNPSISATTNAAGRAQMAAVSPVDRGSVLIDATARYQGETASTVIRQTNVETPQEAAALRSSNNGGNPSLQSGGGSHVVRNTIAAIVGGAAAAEAYVLTTREDSPGTNGTTPATNTAPAVSVTTTRPLGLQAATSFPFTASASDQDKDPLLYNWATNDGQSQPNAGPVASFTFVTPGMKTVTVSVSDGKTSTSAQTIVEARSVAGTWIGTVSCPPNVCSTSLNVTLDAIVQNGSNLSGTARLVNPANTTLYTCTGSTGIVLDVTGSPQRFQFVFQSCTNNFPAGQSCSGMLDAALRRVLPNTSGTAASCDVTKQ